MSKIVIIDVFDELKDENKRLYEENKSIIDLLNKFKRLLTAVEEMCVCSKQPIFESMIKTFEIDFKTILDKEVCVQQSVSDDNCSETDYKANLLNLCGDDHLIGTDHPEQPSIVSNNDDYSDTDGHKKSLIVSNDNNQSETEDDSNFEDFNGPDDSSDEVIKQNKSKTNSNTKKNKCDYVGCGLSFRSIYNLRVHISRKHTFERQFKCDLCSKSFIEKYELNTHKKKIHFKQMPLYRYQCHSCQYQTQNRDRVRRHIHRWHSIDGSNGGSNDGYKCGSNSHIATNKTEANGPALLETSDTQYNCQLCDFKTQIESQLKQHIRVIHSDEDYKWICSYDGCDKKYKRKYDLDKHILKNHTEPKELNFYDCPSCEYRSLDKSRMNRHIFTVHSTDMNEVKKYICGQNGCDKRYKTKYDLKQHIIRVHFVDYNVKCDFDGCSKMFKHISFMKKHKKAVHSGIVFQCDWPGCDAKFKNKFNYTDHKNIHISDKPFECTFEGCSMKFTKKMNMLSHKAVHYKKYVCSWPECGQRFSAKRLLVGHLNMHQNSRQFKCTFGDCHKDFWTKNNLDQHIKKVHLRPKN